MVSISFLFKHIPRKSHFLRIQKPNTRNNSDTCEIGVIYVFIQNTACLQYKHCYTVNIILILFGSSNISSVRYYKYFYSKQVAIVNKTLFNTFSFISTNIQRDTRIARIFFRSPDIVNLTVRRIHMKMFPFDWGLTL